jgi:hypothetical protein
MLARATVVAAVLLLIDGCGCTAASCSDGISIEGALASRAEPLSIEIVVCRNDVCNHGSFSSGPNATGKVFRIELQGALEVSASVHTNSSQWTLDIGLDPDDGAGPFEDGDSLHVEVTRDGALLASLDREVDYERSSPNGDWCGPICDDASFQLEPAR